MRTSSPRTFNAFINLLLQDVVLVQVSSTAGHRRSSQFTAIYIRSLQHYSREIREEAILTEMGYAGPGSASLGMIATWARFAHVNILHRSGSSNSTICFRELMSTIPLSYLSICHTNTCQTVKYRRVVNFWYSSGAMMFARLSVSCR